MASWKDVAELIFPHAKPISYRFEQYPKRPNGQVVTRFAPSPTGFFHTGGIFTALVASRWAHQHDGVFVLRIEDTDQAREVPGAIDLIIRMFKVFGIVVNEGPIGPNNTDVGNYGPYIQSKRKTIYESFAKHLIAEGKAYPCWLTPEELEQIRQSQQVLKQPTGIYGNYSVWRNKTPDECMKQYEMNQKCVIRFRSHGDMTRKVVFNDINRGEVVMVDNYLDIVLIKSSDGLPTYHFASVIDDTLMGVSHITRADERLVSVPIHLQLYQALNLQVPLLCHLAPLAKSEDGKKRKISKRKDPEANVEYILKEGYTPEGLLDYLLTIIDSGYEEWQNLNPDKTYRDFQIDLSKTNNSRALFDMNKLRRMNNRYLSKLSNQRLYDEALVWAKEYDSFTFDLLSRNPQKALQALSIERLTPTDPKRFTTFADIAPNIDWIYDDIWLQKITSTEVSNSLKELPLVKNNLSQEFVNAYSKILDLSLSKEDWFTQLKQIGKEFGFAPDNQTFKQGGYIGKIGDLAMFLRIACCGSTKTPDLYTVMCVLGKEKVIERMQKLIKEQLK